MTRERFDRIYSENTKQNTTSIIILKMQKYLVNHSFFSQLIKHSASVQTILPPSSFENGRRLNNPRIRFISINYLLR